MLNLPTTTRIFVCTQPTDMRKNCDGLSGIIEQVFDAQLLSGDVFVFVNRRRDRLKAMAWDGDGFWIWYKRLEAGTFQLPSASSVSVELDAAELSMILGGIDLSSVRRRKRYRIAEPRSPRKTEKSSRI